MRTQLLDRVEFPLQLFLGQELMNLGMAGAAKSDDRMHGSTSECSLVSFVVMPGAGDEMMAREGFLPMTERTVSLHVLLCCAARDSSTSRASRRKRDRKFLSWAS